MDNLCHSLFALTLARTRLGRSSPLATPLLVVAANLPDLDIVVRPLGGAAAYLAYHRGITHALLGIAVQVVVLTWLASRLERRIAPEAAARGAFARGGPFAAVAVGLATHPFLDGLNTYGLRPWLPFDGAWIYGDLVFVVDPWLWLLLGAAAALGGPRSLGGDVAWSLVALAATLVVFLVDEPRPPLALRVAWIPVVVAVGLLRWRRTLASRGRAVLVVAAALGILHLGTLFLLRERAERLARAEVEPRLHAGEILMEVVATPSVADPGRWTILFETERRVLWEVIDVFEGRVSGHEEPKRMDDPRVLEAAETEPGSRWRSFVRVPVARVEERDGRSVVRLSDARYWFTDWCTVVVPLPSSSR